MILTEKLQLLNGQEVKELEFEYLINNTGKRSGLIPKVLGGSKILKLF